MSEQGKTARYIEKFKKRLRVCATVLGIGGLAATGVGAYTFEHTLSGAATKKFEQLDLTTHQFELFPKVVAVGGKTGSFEQCISARG